MYDKRIIERSGERCFIEYGQYPNERIAIQLLTVQGEPMATASVNLVNAECPPGHTYIKNWSENEGVLELLVKEGIVEDTGKTKPSSFVIANLVKLTPQFTEDGKPPAV